VLVAFALRALVPTGYMPGHGGLVICDGYAPASAAAPTFAMNMADMTDMDMSAMDISSPVEHPSKGGSTPGHDGFSLCPFAAAATNMAMGQSVAFTAVAARIVIPRIQFPPERFIPRGTIVPTRLPRGPPSAA